MNGEWIRPVIKKTYDLSEAYQAHKDVITNSGSKGKLVVKCQ